jgi:DNA-binding LacI/PurR family transcriptional regulator
LRGYRKAIGKNPDADVYVCLSDTLAVPVIRYLQQEGRKAAVSGYANFEIAEVFGLSTVEQNIPQLGIKAFQHLFFSIQYIQRHGQFPEYSEERIPSEFIRRQSCGCGPIH